MADTKNPGPLLVSFGAGDINALPVEWRARMGYRQEDQQMPPSYTLPANGHDSIGPPDPDPVVISENRLLQTRTDERKRTSVVLNPPPPNGGIVPPGGGPPDSWTLVAEERLPWGQVATRTRAFVPQGSHLVLSDDMLQAEQRNLGIGLDQVVLTAPLPGPGIVDTEFDNTSSLVSTIKTRKLISTITDGETIVGNVWRQVTHKSETATVASEVVMSRTLPGPTLPSTRFDQNSVLVTILKTKKLTSAIATGESVTPTLWLKTYGDGETGLISTEIVESRALPGPALLSTRFDNEAVLVTTTKTQKKTDQFADGETIAGNVWQQTTREAETANVATQVVLSRTLPGPTIPSTRFDNNSVLVTINKTKKLTSAIIEGETVTPTLWTKTYGDGETGLISTEISEVRALPGPAIISSRFDTDNTLVTITETQKKADQFVDGETIQGNVWTRTTRKGETGQVATEVKESRTVPGPTIIGFRLDNDDAVVTVAKTKKLIGNINEGEVVTPTQWIRTYSEAENVLIATEVVETRDLGAAAPSVVTTHYDTDNTLVTVTKTKKKSNQFTDGEDYNSTTHVWTRTTREGISEQVATEVIESRHLPGQDVTSYRLDEDGAIVTVVKTKMLLSDINEGEYADDVTWTRITAEGETLLFATKVVETRSLGGPSVTSYRIDTDGATVTFVKTKKRIGAINEDETATAVVWTKTYAEQVTAKVANEVVETRPIGPGGAPVVRSSRTDPRGFVVRIEKVKRLETSFSQSNTSTATLWTKVYKENVTGLVATQVTEFVDLPGTQLVDTKVDADGFVLTTKRTLRQTADCATSGEDLTGTVWTRTSKEVVDGPISMEVLEQRPIPGPAVASTRIDPDGLLVNITKTKESVDDVTPPVGETLTGNVWKKIYTEGEDQLIVTKVVETRNLNGAPSTTSSRIESDGLVINITKTRRPIAGINPRDTATNTLWTKVFHEDVDGLVCTEVVETAVLPGPTITSSRIDDDSFPLTITKTRKNSAATSEVMVGNVWTKTYGEGTDGPVVTEVVETRTIPGHAIKSTRLDPDGQEVAITKTKVLVANIDNSETLAGNTWKKSYNESVNNLIATQVVETRILPCPVLTSHRLDRDGLEIQVTKQRIAFSTNLNPGETATDTLWTRTYFEELDGLIVTKVIETAVLPGPIVKSTKTEDDGRITTITKQRRHATDITDSEVVNGTIWTKSYREGESGALATQVIETRSVAVSSTNVVPSAHVDQDLVVVSVTKALKLKANVVPNASIAGGNLTTVEQKEVSDLVSEEIKSVKPTFDSAKYVLSIENPLPPGFRSLGVVKDEVHVLAGQAISPSGLAAGQIESSQEQLNALQKRTVVKSLDTSSLPVAYAGKEISTEYGGIYLLTEKKIALNSDTTVDITSADVTDATIVKDKIERYASFKVRDKATVTGGFPVLHGGDVDTEFGVLLPYTQQVVSAYPTPPVPAFTGSTATEIKPLDVARSLKTIRTIDTTNITGFKMSFPGTTDVSIPPQLISLTGINAGQGGGAGSYTENGNYTIVNEGSGAVNLSGEANSSAYSSMDVIPKVKVVWGQNIACMHYLFFMAGTAVTSATVLAKLNSLFSLSAVAWPKFQPESITISVIGGKQTATARARQQLGNTVRADYLGRPVAGAGFRTAGAGTSLTSEVNVKTMTIPPTIHAGISVAGTSLLSSQYGAVAQINCNGNTTASTLSQAGSFVSPTSFAATGGQQTIPSGTFLHRVRVEPWKFGYFKCDCEVVSSNDW